jgi:arsenate reductase
MAEAFLKQHCRELFEVESAGITPGTLNPFAVQAMAKVGCDISQNLTKDIYPFIRVHPTFDYVITVCDEASGQHCPTFPRTTTRLQRNFVDPSSFTGTDQEKLVQTREVRDAIQARVQQWCAEVCAAAHT